MIVPALDLSMGHMTYEDSLLLAEDCERRGEDPARSGMPAVHCCDHWYGFVVFVVADDLELQMTEMREAGYSKAFRHIYRQSAERGVRFIVFDREGERNENLPTFGW